MTPQEKAIELIDKYKGLVYPYIGSSMLINEPNDAVILANAKICVGILIDEIIKSNPISPSNNNYQETEQDRIDDAVEYWTEVKKELEKM